eukprot:2551488-Prymnesium_polylepis.1
MSYPRPSSRQPLLRGARFAFDVECKRLRRRLGVRLRPGGARALGRGRPIRRPIRRGLVAS